MLRAPLTRPRPAAAWTGLLLLAAASSAQAHDFWLQPRSYWIAPGALDPLSVQVGHVPVRQIWAADPTRVVQLRSLGPLGPVDRRAELRTGPRGDETRMAFKEPGVHVLAFQTTPAFSDLPALRFNAYAKDEGLAPAIAYRAAHGLNDQPGREIYSRRAKALVRVGDDPGADDRQVTTPVGLSLEIVPERNPYALGPRDPVPVRIYYGGRPLAGALVKLTNLEFDNRPLQTRLSDAEGRAAFDLPRRGTWLINVIWTQPLKGNPRADFETTFSSLTFGFPTAPGVP
jgi:uncharacterized GH25 family protein